MDSFFEIFHCGSPSSFQYCNLSSPSLPRWHYLSATWENTEHLSRFELLEPSQVHSFRFNGPHTLHCDHRYLEYEFRAHTRKQQIRTQYPYAVVWLDDIGVVRVRHVYDSCLNAWHYQYANSHVYGVYITRGFFLQMKNDDSFVFIFIKCSFTLEF